MNTHKTRAPQERALRTRAAILGSALKTLAEVGVARASTARIAKEAGVSQGALFGHFATRSLLWSAALELLLDELLGRSATELGDLLSGERASPEELIGGAVDVLWEVFNDPRLVGAYELFLAARTDPELSSALGPVLQAHAVREVELGRTLFAGAADRPGFDATVLGLLATLQGAAVGAAARPQASAIELEFIRDIARREFATALPHLGGL